MNLSLRLNLLLLGIVLATLSGTCVWVVVEARRAVADELHSTLELASGLLHVIAHRGPVTSADGIAEFARVTRSIRARHLDIRLREAGDPGPWTPPRATRAPGWYATLTAPAPNTLIRHVALPGTTLQVEVRADPTDEIDESWTEARRTLAIVVGMGIALTFLFRRWAHLALRPLARLSQAMARIESGDYGVRLGRFAIPDLDTIAVGFDEMAAAQQRMAAEVADHASRALMIREEERRHLAHELHDELGQSISAIKALAVSISRRADPDDDRIRRSADTIADVSTHMYDRVRQMMSQLRPTTLDELGLVAALEDMIDTWNSHHEDLFCAFNVRGELPPLTPDQRINLYRIVQEALTNVARHAGAATATVTLVYDGADPLSSARLQLTIVDDGRGFEPQAARQGLGLVGIGERVTALKGNFTLATRPGAGTELRIDLPLETRREPVETPDEHHSYPAGG